MNKSNPPRQQNQESFNQCIVGEMKDSKAVEEQQQGNTILKIFNSQEYPTQKNLTQAIEVLISKRKTLLEEDSNQIKSILKQNKQQERSSHDSEILNKKIDIWKNLWFTSEPHEADIVDMLNIGDQNCSMILKWYPNSLRKILDSKKKLSEAEILKITKKIASIFMDEGGQEKFLCGNVKPINILIDDQYDILLSDLLELQTTDEEKKAYVAPEVFESNKTANSKSDVYSIGIILLECIYGEVINSNKIKNIQKYWDNLPNQIISSEAKDLIQNMIHIDPIKRFDWEDVYNHKVLESIKIKTNKIEILQINQINQKEYIILTANREENFEKVVRFIAKQPRISSNSLPIALKNLESHLRNLTTFSLNFANLCIDSNSFIQILQRIQNQPNIRKFEFNLTKTNINNESIIQIAQLLKNNSNIEAFECYLDECKDFDETSLIKLIEALNDKQNLMHFKLSLKATKVNDSLITSIRNMLKNKQNISTILLDLSHCAQVTDESIEVLLESFEDKPNLKDLNLNFNYCKRITDKSIIAIGLVINDIFYIQKFSLGLKKCTNINSESMLALAMGLKNFSKLKELYLDLEKTKIGYSQLIRIINGLKLMTKLEKFGINLKGCKNINEKSPIPFAMNINGISKIKEFCMDLENIDITDDHMGKIINTLGVMENLTKFHINLKECTKISGNSIKALGNVFQKNSKMIDFDLEMPKIKFSDEEIRELIQAIQIMDNLTKFKINLRECSGMTDNSLILFIEALSNKKDLTDLFLDLSQCLNITGESIIALGMTLKRIPKLTKFNVNLENCSKISSGSLTAFGIALKSSKNITNFSLNLGKCPNINDESFLALSKGIQSKSIISEFNLNLEQCYNIYDKSLISLANSIKNQKNLTNFQLNLSECENLSDNSINSLAEAIENKENIEIFHLNLSECKISDESITSLIQALQNKQKIKEFYLNLKKCNNISDQSIVLLANALKKMKNLIKLDLILINCHEITDRSMVLLKQALNVKQNLERLVLDLTGTNVNNASIVQISEMLKKNQEIYMIDLCLNNNFPTIEILKCPKNNEKKIKICLNKIEINNQTIDETVETLRDERNLTRVTMNLDNMAIQDQQLKQIIEILRNQENMIAFNLNLTNTKIEDISTKYITEVVENQKNMSKFAPNSKKISNCVMDESQIEVDDIGKRTILKLDISQSIDIKRIPGGQDISKYFLSLKDCRLDDELISTIALDLANKSEISDLSLELPNTDINDIQLMKILRSLKNLDKIVKFSINLKSCQKFKVESLSYIGDLLKANKNEIKDLNLNLTSTQTDDRLISKLSNALGETQNLENLNIDLSCCTNITENILEDLKNAIFNKNNLKQFLFTFADTKIVNSSIIQFADQYKNNQNIKRIATNLDCFSNSGNGPIIKLGTPDNENEKLINLTLHLPDTFSEKSIMELVKRLKDKEKITDFDLDLTNYLIDDELKHIIIQVLKNQEKISNFSLNLGGNNINDDILEEIINAAQDLFDITKFKIDLQNCKNISDKPIISLAKAENFLSNVQEFYLNAAGTKVTNTPIIQIAHILRKNNRFITLEIDLDDISESSEGPSIKYLDDESKIDIILNYSKINSKISKLNNTIEDIKKNGKKMEKFELNLNGQKNIEKETIFLISAILKNIEELNEFKLDLGNTHINDDSLIQIIGIFNEKHNITDFNIDLRGSAITNDSISEIAKIIQTKENITRFCLNLFGTKINDDALNELAEALKEKINLKEFDLTLQATNISDDSMTNLAKSLENLKEIEKFRLDLDGTKVNEDSIKELAKALKNRENIKEFKLDLRGTVIGNSSLLRLAETVNDYKELETFGLRVCKTGVNDSSIMQLARAFQGKDNIKNFELSLFGTNVGDSSLLRLGEIFKEKKNLEVFEIDLWSSRATKTGATNLKSTVKPKKFIAHPYFD